MKTTNLRSLKEQILLDFYIFLNTKVRKASHTTMYSHGFTKHCITLPNIK